MEQSHALFDETDGDAEPEGDDDDDDVGEDVIPEDDEDELDDTVDLGTTGPVLPST